MKSNYIIKSRSTHRGSLEEFRMRSSGRIGSTDKGIASSQVIDSANSPKRTISLTPGSFMKLWKLKPKVDDNQQETLFLNPLNGKEAIASLESEPKTMSCSSFK
jgi:hypothetical protein